MDKGLFNWQLIDAGLDEVAEADPEIRAAKEKYLKRKGSIWEITRELGGIPYASTGTKSELVELEKNMRELIREGAYGYKYIESLLISYGYGLAAIRATFQKLTGVEPEIYIDIQRYLDTPGTIPGVNYGWGKSKDASYDYYFIMPWKFGYEIFGQKGDLQRDEVSFFTTLPETKGALEKKVVELFYYDKPVSEKDIKAPEIDLTELSEPSPLGFGPVKVTSEYKNISDYIYKLGDRLSDHEKKSLLNGALEMKQIDKDQHEALMVEAGLKDKKEIKLPNPKELTDSDLWWIIQNVFPEKAPEPIKESIKSWYEQVEKEFSSRDVELKPIMEVEYPLKAELGEDIKARDEVIAIQDIGIHEKYVGGEKYKVAQAVWGKKMDTEDTELMLLIEGFRDWVPAAWFRKASIRKAEPTIESTEPGGEENIKKSLEQETVELSDKVKKEPFESYEQEVTPQDFFDNARPETPDVKTQDVVGKVMDYIGNKNKELSEFSVTYKSFKYVTKELEEKIEKNLQVPGQEIEEIFSSNAVVQVELILKDETLPSNVNEKRGLMVFTVIGGDIITDDNLKGEDNRFYALTDAGLENYFRGERVLQEQEENE